MVTFGQLTSPLSPDEFLATCWTERAVLLRDPHRRFEGLFDWAALNTVLNSGDLTFPATVVSRNERVIPAEEFTRGGDGKTVDVQAVMRLFREGASFSVRGAGSYWPPLKAILDALNDTFFESAHANVYCSPANTQGFRAHYDLHEVFVLQIEGAKHWRVFPPTSAFPVEPWREEDAPTDADVPYIDATLEKGDVLYVPRGHWHYAVAQDSDSLHITAGITCRKGDSFLDWLRPQLLADPVWRQNVPAMGKPGADGRLPATDEVVRWTAALREHLLEKLQEPGLFERYVADLFVDSPSVSAVSMPMDGAPRSLPVESLMFRRPAGQRHVIAEADDSRLLLKVARTEMALEDVPRALVAGMLGSDRFTFREACGWAPSAPQAEISELLEHFVRSGLLVAEEEATESAELRHTEKRRNGVAS